MEKLCLPVDLVLVSGSHRPQRRFGGWGWVCCYFFPGDGSGLTQP